jgi:Cys-tRNA(Pro)/Cys-tRNA(Cys) deacylase
VFTLKQLHEFLLDNNSNFEIIEHETPIISTQDAVKYFDIRKAAPTFIMQTENELVAFIISSQRGKIDFKIIKEALGFSKFKFADKDKVEKVTGYSVGAIPFIGHNLPCIFDKQLLELDFIYGGSGDAFHTLKIAPVDVERLNNVIKYI